MDDNPEFLDLNPDSETGSATAAEPEISTPSEETDSPVVPVSAESSAKPAITFRGNSYDLASVVGLTIGAMVLLSCLTCNLAYYCLPVIPVILGIIGLAAAKDSVDPDRTKLLSWLSLGSGAVILVLIFLFMAAYIGLIVFVVMADNGGF